MTSVGGGIATTKITGNEGNFEFSCLTDDDIMNFNKPIAVGARLDSDGRRCRPVVCINELSQTSH